MGHISSFRQTPGRRLGVLDVAFYLLPVVFGLLALFAGITALSNPLLGLALLMFVMGGFIGASALIYQSVGDTQSVQGMAGARWLQGSRS